MMAKPTLELHYPMIQFLINIDSLSAYLRKIKKDGIIDDATFHKILPSGSSPGVLYGLPKVH